MPTDEIQARTAQRTLADFTGPALIVPALRGKDAAGVIHELSSVLSREGRVPDLLRFYQAALNGEYLAETVTAFGWALPHARSIAIDRPCFAMGRCPAPISWVTPARRPVETVLLIGVPETDAREYLGLLAALARLSRSPELSGALVQARTCPEILEVFRRTIVQATVETVPGAVGARPCPDIQQQARESATLL